MSRTVRYSVGRATLELVEGDITQQDTDAIVNAANSGLRGGGGVDGAIHRAGGPSILAECKEIGGCPAGEAVVTGAGDIPVGSIIHTVGPRYRGGNAAEAQVLESAYRASMARARELEAESVAFPSLSTGAYGYPLAQAAPIAIRTLADELRKGGPVLVRLVLFGDEAFAAYETAAAAILGR